MTYCCANHVKVLLNEPSFVCHAAGFESSVFDNMVNVHKGVLIEW